MRRRKALAVGTAVVVLGAAVAVVATGTIDTPLTQADTGDDSAAPETTVDDSESDSSDELDMVGIERGDLTSTSEFTGELGFGEVVAGAAHRGRDRHRRPAGGHGRRVRTVVARGRRVAGVPRRG